jgi:hypothetical protein
MYMSLDVKKIYVETRFKTDDSKSDSDFFIELPRTFNVPENCVCYLDDFVIPVSWSTVDDRNNKLYLHIDYASAKYYYIITIPIQNYGGLTFAVALEAAINLQVQADFGNVMYKVDFVQNDNEIKISQTNFFELHTYIVSSDDLRAGKYWSQPIARELIQSMNGILRIGTYSYMLQEAFPWKSYLDLFTTRNLYLTSSALASYSNISNFKTDVIVKKIPVTATFGQMMFYNATTGYDFLDVSRRSLTRIDFRLQDSYGNVVNLRGNHFSFSMVFAEK